MVSCPLSQRGFTLIELSVVLVIIGLIIGGVLAGRTMVRASQLQSLVTDESKYVEAARQFREKYGYLPGDFPGATNYWGTDPNACPNTGPWGTAAQAATCNGNGDGAINGDGTGTSSALLYETWRAWQQLSDAGYIEGGFTGTPGASCNTLGVPGGNEPASKVTGGGFEWNYFSAGNTPTAPGGGQTYPGLALYTQYLLIGGAPPSSCGSASSVAPLLTASEALSIDTKIDDGMPAAGKWIAGNYSGLCETAATPPVYNTQSALPACSFAAQVDW